MKKLYFLDESEKERILNMHKDATKKQYLTESKIKDFDNYELLNENPIRSRTKRVRDFLFGKGSTEKYGGVHYGPKTKEAFNTYKKEFETKINDYRNQDNTITLVTPTKSSVKTTDIENLESTIQSLKDEKTQLNVDIGIYRNDRVNPKLSQKQRNDATNAYNTLIKDLGSIETNIQNNEMKLKTLKKQRIIRFDEVANISIDRLINILQKRIENIKLSDDELNDLNLLLNNKIVKPDTYDIGDEGVLVPKSSDTPIEFIDTPNDNVIQSLFNLKSRNYKVKPEGGWNKRFMRWAKMNPVRYWVYKAGIIWNVFDFMLGITFYMRWIGLAFYNKYQRYIKSRTTTEMDDALYEMCLELQSSGSEKRKEKDLTFTPDEALYNIIISPEKDVNKFKNKLNTNLKTIKQICRCAVASIPMGETKIKLHDKVKNTMGWPQTYILKEHVTIKYDPIRAKKQLEAKKQEFKDFEITFNNYQYRNGSPVKVKGNDLLRYARIDKTDTDCQNKFYQSFEFGTDKFYLLAIVDENGKVEDETEEHPNLPAVVIYEAEDDNGIKELYYGCKKINPKVLDLIHKAQEITDYIIYKEEAEKKKQEFIKIVEEIKKELGM